MKITRVRKDNEEVIFSRSCELHNNLMGRTIRTEEVGNETYRAIEVLVGRHSNPLQGLFWSGNSHKERGL